MIDRDFWEEIAGVWAKKEEIEIPTIDPGEIVPPEDSEQDYIDFDDADEIDDFLKDILENL